MSKPRGGGWVSALRRGGGAMITAGRGSGVSTLRRLQRLRLGLVAATGVATLAALLTFAGIQAAVAGVRDGTAPAVLGVLAAQDALVKADNALVTGFDTGQVELTGPGERHQSELVIARQSLTQVAENNAAGVEGSRALQVVDGLLAGYANFVGQADAHYRHQDGRMVGAADLWYASRLMHAPDNGILARLDALADLQHDALRERLSGGWLAGAVAGLWLLPALLLLGLLGYTQYRLRRKFRRRWNFWLLGATTLLLGLILTTSFAFGSVSGARDASATVDTAVAQWRSGSAAEAAAGRPKLVELLRETCAGSCGEVVGELAAGLPAGGAAPPATAGDPADDGRRIDGQLAAADLPAYSEFLIAALGLAIAGLVVAGFHRRVDEYRFRST
ncbi:hypothetical protein [Amycolatopsis sp. 195334CR]|uniref:hypothetical protein n=1 Tax=Amycolatopsis sp. 195334CR TaxID=2814588 RepID=UPI001A8D4ACB|nr:hypothetical protein [Amycolatopsis sp. 195334CR]MBN6039150.1 hypothetical protein [Amycolatopsis sp. 195334CR]